MILQIFRLWALRLLQAVLVVLTTGLSSLALASYPDKPIRMIIPWPPGGGSDVLGRIVAKHMSDVLGQPVVVENRAGATGLIGTDMLVKSAPDGYTIVFIADSYIVSPLVSPKTARYDVNKDFTNIGMVGFFPLVLVVNPQNNPGDLKQFIQKGKDPASKMTYSSWGIGSSSHLATEMFLAQTGSQMLHVPFQGAAPAMTAVLGGQVDSVFVPAVVALPHHNAGKAKILGVSSQNRLAAAPQLMTMVEQGVQSWISWMGILGPVNIPAERADKLTAALKAVVENPKVREELTRGGLDPNFMNQKQLTDFVRSENIRVGNVVKNAKISID